MEGETTPKGNVVLHMVRDSSVEKGQRPETNEIRRWLIAEHKNYLLGLSNIEAALCGSTPCGEDDVWGTLETFLGLLEKLKNHFLKEEDIIFSELDKLPGKEPLTLVHLEHDDWERISHVSE